MGVVAFIARDLYVRIVNKKKRSKETKMLHGLKAIVLVGEAMDMIKENSPAERVLLLEVSDSGEAPKPGSRMFSRAIDVKLGNHDSKPRQDILAHYGEFLIDQAYIDMVIEAKRTQRAYRFDVDKHPPCLLRSIYIDESIKYSEIYHVYSDTEKWKQYIVSISTNKEGEQFTDTKGRAAIDIGINAIRQAFTSII
jgi:hypothetical protein